MGKERIALLLVLALAATSLCALVLWTRIDGRTMARLPAGGVELGGRWDAQLAAWRGDTRPLAVLVIGGPPSAWIAPGYDVGCGRLRSRSQVIPARQWSSEYGSKQFTYIQAYNGTLAKALGCAISRDQLPRQDRVPEYDPEYFDGYVTLLGPLV